MNVLHNSSQIRYPIGFGQTVLIALVALGLTACSTPPRTKPATITDRSTPVASVPAQEPVPPGFYRVKRGDTLIRIALDNGQSYRDIATWNNITDPNLIEVDQVLRVKPPPSTARVVTKPIEPIKPADSKASTDKKVATKKVDEKEVAAAEPKVDAVDPPIKLSWPAKGKVVEEFNEAKNKGIDIAGKMGEPIQAAADGKVVYAGNSLRGYGNLVIIKHDNTYLTAYAHNRTLVVKEGENVRKGQRIAEMGDSDANMVKLHFEVRMNGKPVNPMQYLQ
ncbi:peptidoglycan DD-metalloendopeptidase family protein [Polynucleobacter sp. HIN8]|uniref:peptidoglycan DD-metalloendopeptidase family protein n=1 Tax=Polynucleobacter sp. HIN8 TaxID=3047867 RepID=UPI00257322BE|nr:peptidoglycan DD-metalloendopeptidase family protein [Polynucleobacter sp. HIN8]BEI39185.1 peptidoglycan DD-metalloendopeptidase family protein [Polynucleobacter sp. HIN8]